MKKQKSFPIAERSFFVSEKTLKHFSLRRIKWQWQKEERKYIYLLFGYCIKCMLLVWKRKLKPQFKYRTPKKKKTHLAALHFTLNPTLKLLWETKKEKTFPHFSVETCRIGSRWFRFSASFVAQLSLLTPKENQLASANDDPLSKAHFSNMFSISFACKERKTAWKSSFKN